ncbi:hypothetical protein J3B02_002138 [Coemansia erecta]|nr:hypothetical protein J3B02_002138 [Coemansia erecta]
MHVLLRAPICWNTEAAASLLLKQKICLMPSSCNPHIHPKLMVSSQSHKTAQQRYLCQNRSRSISVEGVEMDIWGHLQHENIHKAVAASVALSQQSENDPKQLLPLTQFMLAKRQLSIECIYAGVYMLEKTCLHSQNHITVIFAALLADTDPELIRLYMGLSKDTRRQIDFALLATLAYHFAKQGKIRRYRQISRLLSRQVQQDVRWAIEYKGDLASLLSKESAQRTDASWMLRRPKADFAKASAAGDVVMDLLRAGIVPDLPVLKTLVSLSVRERSMSGICMLYATRKISFGFPEYVLIRLTEMRKLLGRMYPRMHYDVIGTFVRSRELDQASLVAIALKSRHAFHFLLQLWTDTFKQDWRAVGTIISTVLRTLDTKLLHSTHHLAVTAVLREFKRALASKEKGSKEILKMTLSLHWKLAPRLESPSLAAVHQLLVALSDHGMKSSVFEIYRDMEKRKEWVGMRSRQGGLANEAILSVLAKSLARTEDIRSIMHLTDMATRTGLRVSFHFYSAVVLGLTDPRYLRPAARHRAKCQSGVIERVQMAETIVATMKKNSSFVPPKLLFSIMHAWALLGHIRRTRVYFYRIKDLIDLHVVSEIPWGMLMYASMRAYDIRGVLGVLNRARERKQIPQTNSQGVETAASKTSYLVNIAMAALVQNGDSRAALSLLDSLGPESESSDREVRHLAVTPTDPVTLNLIVGALLAKDRIQQAIEIYDSIRSQYGLAESVPELKRFMQHCIKHRHLSEALEIYQRLLRSGYTLRESQWISLVLLCMDQRSYQTVAYLLDCLCVQVGLSRALSLFRRNRDIAECICQALAKTKGREELIAKIKDLFTSPITAVSPETLHGQDNDDRHGNKHAYDCDQDRAERLALYRRLFRAARQFPLAEMRRKLCYNVRFGFELYRHLDHDDVRVKQLINEAKTQARWIQSWQADFGTLRQITHKPSKNI